MSNSVMVYDGSSCHAVSLAFPSGCGICHKLLGLEYITGSFVKGDPQSLAVEAVFRCKNSSCNRLIVGYYQRKNVNVPFKLARISPIQLESDAFSEEIVEISPNFVKFYNQLYSAEKTGNNLITGVGYRKALEFLIKDYLLYLGGEDKDSIKNLPLDQCLNKIDNQNIRKISQKAQWLKSDKDHYSHEWNGNDVKDLKKMIDIAASYITLNTKLKKHLEGM